MILTSSSLLGKQCLNMSNASLAKQSRAQEHHSAISELQGQGQALQVSLTSQRDLPSVGVTQEGMNLRDEVFNYVPGTVNTNRGAAVYDSPDQAFSFQKHV